MVQIDLSPEKAGILREVLISSLADLNVEIGYANIKEFQEFLKQRSDLLEKVLQRLEGELNAQGNTLIPLERLRKVDILQGLTDWELKSVSQFFQEENFPSGVTFCREGERADRLFILEEGSVSIRMQGGEGMTIDWPGKTVGCSFLVPPNRYTASAHTLSPSRMLVIKSPDFSSFLHIAPRMGIKVMANLTHIVAGRLVQFKSRM